MQNKELARLFRFTSQLLELHDDNPFKVKSYANASFQIDRSEKAVFNLPVEELEKIQGIGKSIAGKIVEIREQGTLADLEKMLTITPKGILEMLSIKGIGAKKAGVLWKQLGVENIGELLYACNENRLIELKGFGNKTQDQIKKAIEFTLANSGKVHYATIIEDAEEILTHVSGLKEVQQISLTGDIRRKAEIIDKIEIVVSAASRKSLIKTLTAIYEGESEESEGELYDSLTIKLESGFTISFYITDNNCFGNVLFLTTGNKEHLEKIGQLTINSKNENSIYESLGLRFIEPELREGSDEVHFSKENKLPELIEYSDLKGVLHNHSTYSDGVDSLREMAVNCKSRGYEYLGICDHSQSAFYANGLKADRVLEQQKEIDQLNSTLAPFKVFKGIESDILNDGSLDYPEEILKTFDFVVASVHSNLKMDEQKAMSRLIKAIENPYTTILGHPTGRLLLARQGYPIDHKKMIDACAANKVVIELNANPYRLDMDWRWIRYATGKGVMISINPDAHSTDGYDDMYFGVCVARKGWLTKDQTFNALNREQLESYFKMKKG